jgi:hypothetical protein
LKKIILLITITIVYFNISNAAVFGKQENLHAIKIDDKKIPVSIDDVPCFLGYKTSGYYFLGGLFLKDDGYVLISQGNADNYFPVTKEDIDSYQNSELLPTPLPTYKIPIVEYLLGYSLWILIIIGILYSVIKKLVFGNDDDELVEQHND